MMQASSSSPRSTHGLSDLRSVELTWPHRKGLNAASADSQGPPEWRARKLVEATDVFALSQIAPRMEVLALDMRTELQVMVRLRCPVPCKSPASDDIEVAPYADIALCYTEEILRGPLPGYALAQIVAPRWVWHPNTSYDAAQRVCLGVRIARNFPLKEVILGCHAALTLQAITIDDRDEAGLMNREAGAWWRANTHRIPLSNVPFLGREIGDEVGNEEGSR